MKCFVLATLMLLTLVSADAQAGADPCQPLYVIHLKSGSEVVATDVRTDSSYHRATVLMRGALVPRAIPSDQVERVAVVRIKPDTGPSAVRIIVEPLGGLALGTLAVIVLGSAAGGPDDFPAVLTMAGYVVGNACGVYLVGDTDRATGSFWATLLGSAISFVALGIGTQEPAFAVLGAPISATIAFNITRRSRCPDARHGAALFGVDRENGRFAFGAPRVSSRISPIDGTVLQKVDVLRVRF